MRFGLNLIFRAREIIVLILILNPPGIAAQGDIKSELYEGKTSFSINWESYQYKVKTTMSINEAVSLNERYYMRTQVREFILKKISSGIEGLYIDNSHRIMDILDENKNFQSEYPLYLQSINVVRLIFRQSAIEASTALPLRGAHGLLAHVPLPWGTMTYRELDEPEYVGDAYYRSKVGNEYEAGLVPMKYSGIIIDMRGMDVNEAMAPRIYTQSGQLIYGPEFIQQRIGVQRGMIAYVNDMKDSEIKVRTGDDPFFTVALTTRGQYKTDIVISSKDAARIMQHPVTLENLQKCRVVFLVDKKND